ncbi:MAG TPA: BON domain-containing protein, partial [Aestuariivirga sp.]|nr:BON domain-containing protein [Aestuariivirga sp.]
MRNKGVRMYKCRPSKWALLAPIFAGLPFVAASWLTSGPAINDVQNRAAGALAAAGAPWAAVNMDGRDAILTGNAPGQDAIDAAVKAVAGTWGVRTVANQLMVQAAEVPVQPAAEGPAAYRVAYQVGYAQHLRDALPNATFVAFTGTPVSSEDRDTRAVFGDYIHVYDMQQAKEDGATVGIYFESRLAKLSLK